ncbi:pilus assembly protein PilW [Photobacterium frigidiphilum]|uniref:Pilus assembly protein PilW n=1 Tax=Photobacterium frigidiphilum TaxID=264736 RepID=A0A2T3JD45_9GAMM|nr:prepilin-type N-terminal cleavage/methylation domain-containing protein [Photobacterium frigidiphilum]PSU46795.1 pilus assembly protein PilW [Photobacterium frigidiphilum]
MAINRVINLVRVQRGMSLIELLVASSLGLIILASVGSVFLSGHNMAAERTKQLMLAQDVNDAIRIMKNDIQRAGYNSDNSGTLILSGASSTIVAGSANDSISYVYEDENAEWRIVKFRFKSGSPSVVQMCVNTVPKSVGGVALSDASCVGSVSSLMDQAYINVTEFKVVPTPLSTSSATSSIINISLSATLKNTSYTKTVSTDIKTRNWN